MNKKNAKIEKKEEKEIRIVLTKELIIKVIVVIIIILGALFNIYLVHKKNIFNNKRKSLQIENQTQLTKEEANCAEDELFINNSCVPCSKIFQNSITCTKEGATSCLEGYTLDEKKCVIDNASEEIAIADETTEAQPIQTVTNCKVSEVLIENNCIPCSQIFDNSVTCTTNGATLCNSNFFVKNNKCTPCPKNSSCNGKTIISTIQPKVVEQPQIEIKEEAPKIEPQKTQATEKTETIPKDYELSQEEKAMLNQYVIELQKALKNSQF